MSLRPVGAAADDPCAWAVYVSARPRLQVAKVLIRVSKVILIVSREVAEFMLICFSPSELDPAAARDWQGEEAITDPIHPWLVRFSQVPATDLHMRAGGNTSSYMGVEERIRLNRTFWALGAALVLGMVLGMPACSYIRIAVANAASPKHEQIRC